MLIRRKNRILATSNAAALKMDDQRLAWMGKRVRVALGIGSELFQELVDRDGGRVGKELQQLLDAPGGGYQPAMVFYPEEREIVEEREVEEEQLIEQMVEQAEQLEGQSQGSGSDVSQDSEAAANGGASKAVKKSIVKETVRRVQLHLCLKRLPEGTASVGFFFQRRSAEPVPVPASPEEAASLLPPCFESGTVSSKPLNALLQKLTHVFTPMLTAAGQRSEEAPPTSQEGGPEDRLRKMQRDELLINVQKFTTQVQRTIALVEGEVKLRVPEADLSADPTHLSRDPLLVAKLEEAMEEWAQVISSTVDEQLHKAPQGKGPLAEVDFWRERSSTLSALYEQLKVPGVQKVLAVMRVAGVASFSSFEYHRGELSKVYLEAKDNVKFLGTLERHFKNLTHGANFAIVQDTLPAMMNSLRMVWVISRHYNTDERMVPLMERIASELCERAARVVNIKTIFRETQPQIKAKALEACRMMESWKQAYLEVRKRIEQSGRDARWEFDRKKLFERSDHTAQICTDIHDVAQTIEEFHNIFGPELKAVTGNPERIEAVLKRVDGLLLDLETVRFDPYNPSNRHEWRSVMSRFQREVKLIEEEANSFIDESFQNLRSAEGAFDMLHNFKHIRSRDSINATMMRKFSEILGTFQKEVERINLIFLDMKDSPPVAKGQPPVAGAITWARSLFQRIKHTVVRFQTMKELIDSEQGKQASRRYLEVARSMKQFEDELYSVWVEATDQTLPGLLKRTVLTTPPSSPPPHSLSHTPLPGDSRSPSRIGGPTPFVPALPANCEYVVNFAPELSEIIAESKYLEKLGFAVPDLARSIALQEEKLLAYQDGLGRCLHRYHTMLATLSEAETELLGDHIRTLQRVIKPGSKRLNWNSLGINDYIHKCEQAMTKFESLANQIHKNAGDIEERLGMVESVKLFKQFPPKTGGDLPEAKEYFECQDSHRAHVLGTLARKYHAIGPLLIKVEGLVVSTNTGKSPRLQHYYSHWERRVFQALVKMVTNNLTHYRALLCSSNPLFSVEVLLSAPEIVLHPHASELLKRMMQTMMEVVESTKQFPRWLKGSCTEAEPQQFPGQDTPVLFSFFTDISAHSAVVEAATSVHEAARSTVLDLVKHANTWKKYRLLWKMQRDIMLEKFAQRKPSCVAYDEKLHFYSSVAMEIEKQPTSHIVGCVLLHLEPLARALKDNSRQWVTSLGKFLNDSARDRLTQLSAELKGLSVDLHKTPDTLEDLKFVLSVIAKIRAMSLEVEMSYRSLFCFAEENG